MSPLTSWDIAEEGMQRRITLQKDLARLDAFAIKGQWNTLGQWRNSLVWEDKIIILTDSFLNILYATENIYTMNGYEQSEVIGRTPRMFQGEKTEREKLDHIKLAVKKQIPFESFITNYKKNGDIYHCHIEGYPVFDEKNKLINFMALENIV